MKYSIFSLADHYEDSSIHLQSHYKQVQEQIELADQLNYNTFWLAEHHFQNVHGSIMSPAVFLSSVSKTTHNIGLGTAVSVLPLHNPIRVAEDFAMLDLLSGGRMRFAVGSGYLQHEFKGFGVEFSDRISMLNEGMDLILQLWTEEQVDFIGEYYKFSGSLNARPTRNMKKPLVATVRKEAVEAMGKKGMPIFISSLSVKKFEQVKTMVETYREFYQQNHHSDKNHDISYCLNIVLDHDEHVAKQMGFKALQKLFDYREVKRTPENFMESGLCFFGTPQQAVKLISSYEKSGITELVLSVSFGNITHQAACNTMNLFSKEVVPLLEIEQLSLQS
ncbi:LLM class flavin-dependent oxidoreductase [Priestia koreensis]|uniref:LLM class flavin-dependent oxidoreductase n=1 Tax=Priestia koreensis TaxID=284581 RepID=UPI001F58070D|nr:LLM class flavin-dependent oxidoreductase [Priestia koreensis]UNL86798.1 LLM class flavin-dependent oxidoreductase [Priestia koreensis]